MSLVYINRHYKNFLCYVWYQIFIQRNQFCLFLNEPGKSMYLKSRFSNDLVTNPYGNKKRIS